MVRFSSLSRAQRATAMLAFCLAIPLAAQGTKAGATGTAIDTAALLPLKWRHVGPEGNRVTSVAGITGDRMTYYAGAASGGLWKTSDGGVTWAPIFDDQPVSSIGALAVAPSDPNIVWAGTGEPFIRSHISIGWGVFRSTDAGKSWMKMGLDNTGRIARIIVHPTNPDIVYVASLGHAYGPQQERGIYRTVDGGRNWERVLFVNDSTGASELIMDPNNPRILFAGMWQVQINTWGRFSGGAGSGIWMSKDGGTTWKRLTGNGLPTTQLGKIGLGMSKANSNRVYALIEAGDGVPAVNIKETTRGRLWRSDDGGTNWQVVSYDFQLAGRTHYYNRFGVMPDNPDEAYFLSANWAQTLDGGRTTIDPPEKSIPGGDHHDIWIDATNGNRMIVSHDGGISITENRGRTWRRMQLPIAQLYHVATDDRVPYFLYGNRQDGPSTRGPSNNKLGAFGIPRGDWSSVGGGESGWAQPDPVDSNLVWSSASGFGSVGGIVTRHDLRTNLTNEVEVWPEATIGHPAGDVKYRFVWTFPLHISPHDHNTVYAGSQVVHRTSNAGRTWTVMSPDLTRGEKSRQVLSGGLTPDNIGVEYSGVLFAIAESPKKAGVIWAGTNDGKVHLSRDNGATWTDLTGNLAGLPYWGTISNIEPSRFDEATAYLSVDGHQVNNRDPFIYRTSDYGKTWKLLVAGIPKSPLSYVHVVREDPAKRGLLYAGTENGVYVSFNDGERWQPLQAGLPHAPVYWITVQERFNDLVIATYGRGFWILDDISPLRTVSADIAATPLHLFAPRDAYRFRSADAPFADGDDFVQGTNPQYGASLHFWLKEATKDSITLTFADAAGKVVRTQRVTGVVGMNRVYWDLATDRTPVPLLRTPNPYAPEVKYPAEGKAAPGLQRYASLVTPGTYTVTIDAAGQRQAQRLVVRRDPSSGAADAELVAQATMAGQIAADVNASVEMINGLEVARAQIANVKATLAADSSQNALRVQSDSVDARLRAVEEQLLQMHTTGRGQDNVRLPYRMTEKLVYLGNSIGSSDYAPTDAQQQVQALLHEQLLKVKAQYDGVMATELASYKQLLRSRNPAGVIF